MTLYLNLTAGGDVANLLIAKKSRNAHGASRRILKNN